MASVNWSAIIVEPETDEGSTISIDLNDDDKYVLTAIDDDDLRFTSLTFDSFDVALLVAKQLADA